FFQAEDGIRDKLVTGVQTCALPILPFLKTETSNCSYQELIIRDTKLAPHPDSALLRKSIFFYINAIANELYPKRVYSIVFYQQRSEERRVGKECSSRWAGV